MGTVSSPLFVVFTWALLAASLPGQDTSDLPVVGRVTLQDPLGVDWPDEWITLDVQLDTGGHAVEAGSLRVVDGASACVPAQFYDREGTLLKPGKTIRGKVSLRVLLHATLEKNSKVEYRVLRSESQPPHTIAVESAAGRTVISNGVFEAVFDENDVLPVNQLRARGAPGSLVTCRWPDVAEPTGVIDCWLELGPARGILHREFAFADPAHRYDMTLMFRAGDPWIDVTDEYAFDDGSVITWDLSRLKPDVVYHPYAYNARTFRPGGSQEDSTLEPPQHPIATLGPIWRDIWFNGGPYAMVYRAGADVGLGFAAVRGSRWQVTEGVSKMSQCLRIHGDRSVPGRVRAELPVDGGRRHWAMVVASPEERKRMSRWVRARADIPLDRVLRDWVLEWPSDAPNLNYSFAFQWFGPFNRHSLNPTTFPRNVRKFLDKRFEDGAKPVASRHLAFLAYVYTNPDYWPGPEAGWRNVGNPNFHTDMYNVPLKIGLLMPDHPHAADWIEYGIRETHTNLMRDSYPGGAWAESLSYSSFFFHITDNAAKLRDASVARPFREWARLKEVARYLAAMHTPTDPRYDSRQKAPLGDTSPGNYIKELNDLAGSYRGVDDLFAEQLARFPEPWENALDLSSREFPGFGAMLRGNPYDDRHESFVTLKAGPARNHYQGDELSFYFAAMGCPLAIDHACHYSPRPWSVAMHNRPDMDGLSPVTIAVPRAFATSDAADVFVADERTWRMSHVPMLPHETVKPGYEYPTTTLPEDSPWVMRRFVMLVKHDPASSKLADYLVVRDEIRSPKPVWQNLHVLTRSIERQGERAFFFPGQLDADLTLHVFGTTPDRVEQRRWGWGGKSSERRKVKGKEYEAEYLGQVIPEHFTPGTWNAAAGEQSRWLRLRARQGKSDWLLVLTPHRRGMEAPQVQPLGKNTVRVSFGDESETIHLCTDGEFQAAVQRHGKTTRLLDRGQVPPLER